MLNLFKSKPSQQDIDKCEAKIENLKKEIGQINKALKMYDDTMINHWSTISRLKGMDAT